MCRTCHVALPDRFNVQNFNDWKARASDPVETTHTMPFAEVPYIKYSTNIKGRSGLGARDFFQYFFSSSDAADLRKQCLAKCDTDQSCCTSACSASCKGPNCSTALNIHTCLNQCSATHSQCPSSCPN